MKRRTALTQLAALTASGLSRPAQAQASDGRPYTERPEVIEFIDQVSAAGLPRDWVRQLLAQGRYAASAERLTTPSLTPAPRNWREYRARNVEPRRIDEGIAFARAQRRWLEVTQQTYGVPPAIVTAIIGIESFYGRQMGSFRTLDVLLTLAFDYPRRAALYREQLTEFLLLAREQRIDPLELRGSYAGAIGLPQFMPASIRRHAVDLDGDGRIDLTASRADALGSVGNYLAAQGWQRELPVAFRAQADSGLVAALNRGITAAWKWEAVAGLGVTIDGELPPDASVLLIDLPAIDEAGAATVELRLGTVNLAALLHYNRSYFYAAAVADLATAIAQGMR